MGDSVDRATAIGGRFLNSGAVAPGVGAACELLAIAFDVPREIGKAVGITAGAAAGAVAEEMVQGAARTWGLFRRNNVAQFADVVLDHGTTLDNLIEEAVANPKRLEVLVRVLDHASRSLDATKIVLLAHMYVETANDDDRIVDVAVLEEAIRQLESPHLRLLKALAQPPTSALIAGHSAEQTDHQGWEESDFLQNHPDMESAFFMLIAKLQAVGFARVKPPWVEDKVVIMSTGEPTWVLTDSGQAASRHLVELHKHTCDGSDDC